MIIRRKATLDRAAMIAAVAGLMGLGLPSHSVLAADNGQSSESGQTASMTIGGQTISTDKLIGKQVVTPDGKRIGEVADLIYRDNTYNDVIIRLDKQHSQMGVVIGVQDQKMSGNRSPGHSRR